MDFLRAISWDAVTGTMGVLGLLGGVVGFIRSVAAGRRARSAEAAAADAQADAAAALAKSADATARIADAVEYLAHRDEVVPGTVLASALPPELDALLPGDQPEWALEPRADGRSFLLRNTGDVTAEGVNVSGAPAELTTLARADQDSVTLQPGQSMIVRVESRLSLSLKQIKVRWRDSRSNEVNSALVHLP